ncbi:MAG: GGDEF domain-containing protein [Candidatus Accumulibacter sp.]|nr:GGDEF domain-containing protein [Accumulibacter sp.]
MSRHRDMAEGCGKKVDSMNHDDTPLLQPSRPVPHPLRPYSAAPVSARPHLFPPSAAKALQPSSASFALSNEAVPDTETLLARIAELEKELEETRKMIFADPLTGALNRRGFERAYACEWRVPVETADVWRWP